MGVAPAIDLTAGQRRTVLALLNRHLPNTTVWAYGSRVQWTSHPASDLDLVAFAKSKQSPRVAELREAFDESNLPFRVDLFVWDDVPEGFRKRIETGHVVLARKERPVCNEWPTVTLGACASLVGDKVAPADCGDLPYIGLEHIGQGTLSLLGTGTAQDVESTKTAFRAGDILFGKLRPYFRKVVRPRFDGICSTDIWVVRPRSEVDAGYLFYLLASKLLIDFANQGTEGTRMPRAKWEQVSRFPVRLPPISEQCAIAQVLGAFDDKIELNRRMGETLEEAASALFKSWFVDFDPVRAKVDCKANAVASLFPSSLQESRLGTIPAGWNVRQLDSIASFLNGLALQKYPARDQDGLPAVKIAQLRKGNTKGADRVSWAVPKAYLVEDGDILFSWSGSLELVVWSGGVGALNQHLFKVKPLDCPAWFVYHWIATHLDGFRRIATDKATTMGHIKRGHLADAMVVSPPLEILHQMSSTFEPLFQQALYSRMESRHLAKLRDTLLSKLLSGEIRIRDAEKIAETAT